jgi:hypothetical protein
LRFGVLLIGSQRRVKMAVEFWTGGDYNTQHEQAAQAQILRDIPKLFKGDDIAFVVFNVHCRRNLDLLVLKQNALIIVELKNWAGPLDATENGKWRAKDGSLLSSNPFLQLKEYRDLFRGYLVDHKRDFLRAQKAAVIDFKHVHGIAAMTPTLHQDSNNFVDPLNTWFVLTGLDHLASEIKRLSSHMYDFSSEELRKFVQDVLKCQPMGNSVPPELLRPMRVDSKRDERPTAPPHNAPLSAPVLRKPLTEASASKIKAATTNVGTRSASPPTSTKPQSPHSDARAAEIQQVFDKIFAISEPVSPANPSPLFDIPASPPPFSKPHARTNLGDASAKDVSTNASRSREARTDRWTSPWDSPLRPPPVSEAHAVTVIPSGPMETKCPSGCMTDVRVDANLPTGLCSRCNRRFFVARRRPLKVCFYKITAVLGNKQVPLGAAITLTTSADSSPGIALHLDHSRFILTLQDFATLRRFNGSKHDGDHDSRTAMLLDFVYASANPLATGAIERFQSSRDKIESILFARRRGGSIIHQLLDSDSH